MSILLTDKEITIANQIPPEEYGAPPGWWHRVSKKVAKAQLKKMMGFLVYYECESVADGIGEYRHRNLRIPEEKWQALLKEVEDK